MAVTPPPDDALIALAGEYVLGTLPPAERAAFAARLAADPAAALAVRDWERRLAPLALRAETGPAPDAEASWAAIAARIGEAPPIANASDPPRLVASNDLGPSLRTRLNAWRAAAIGLAAAVAALLVMPGLRGPGVAPAPPSATDATAAAGGQLVAALTPPEGQMGLLLTVDPATGTVLAQPVSLTVPEGRALQLWLIEGTAPPRPVGMLDPARPVALQLGEAAGALREAVFAVSVEPPGGSPTGAPTGPVIQQGRLVELARPGRG
jgi:anti-sigma-K factor RskA